MYARLPGIRPHLAKALELEGKQYTIRMGDDDEIKSLFAFLEDDQYELQKQRDEKSTLAPGIHKTKDHEWNPAKCISVPGTVFGVGYRCTCAHGAVEIKGGDDDKKPRQASDFTHASLLIEGVSPTVVRKVVCMMYGYDEIDFESHEVQDAILLAREFQFKDLLILLYKKGHFLDWGCALWDAGRLIDPQLGEDWLKKILLRADVHFEKDTFKLDGAQTLSEDGLAFLMKQNELNCEEFLIWEAMMEWSIVRCAKAEQRANAEKAMIEELKLELEWDEQAKTRLDKKKEALEKQGPTLKSIAERFAKLVRYPFIQPELLKHSVTIDPNFQKIGLVDDEGVPLVLSAVFHQDGQPMPGWNSSSWNWTPRRGSIIYSGLYLFLSGRFCLCLSMHSALLVPVC